MMIPTFFPALGLSSQGRTMLVACSTMHLASGCRFWHSEQNRRGRKAPCFGIFGWLRPTRGQRCLLELSTAGTQHSPAPAAAHHGTMAPFGALGWGKSGVEGLGAARKQAEGVPQGREMQREDPLVLLSTDARGRGVTPPMYMWERNTRTAPYARGHGDRRVGVSGHCDIVPSPRCPQCPLDAAAICWQDPILLRS